MRKTVYVILVLCCFIIKTYSINRPYYHFKQLSIKEGLPTSIISLYDDKNGFSHSDKVFTLGERNRRCRSAQVLYLYSTNHFALTLPT